MKNHNLLNSAKEGLFKRLEKLEFNKKIISIKKKSYQERLEYELEIIK